MNQRAQETLNNKKQLWQSANRDFVDLEPQFDVDLMKQQK
jgi:hypothetical protein